MVKNVRNVLIVCVIAALVVIVPGGGTGAAVVGQAIGLIFLASLAWVASLMYREHRFALLALGDRRRTILYASAGVLTLTLTASGRLTATVAGTIVWVLLLAVAVYAAVAVVFSARRL